MNRVSRCINLDWLEVAVLEPVDNPRDADYYALCGFLVNVREYGTRVWGSMFTIDGDDHLPLMEVRRAPKSEIIAPNVAHLRLVNRACYFDNAATLMAQWITMHGYEFLRIVRVDICLDFEYFDYGDLPADFLRRYLENKYSKINQANISAHGSDEWAGRVWNSVSWGSTSSDIGTKFYNKTLELYDPISKRYKKPYIRQAWFASGLVDDPVNVTKTKSNGEIYTPDIWRVEFSIRSSVKNWFLINLDGKQSKKQSIRNTLEMYSDKAKLLVLFASLSQHYFHFKHLIKRYRFYQDGKTDGDALRKDRCPDKLLFKWGKINETYKVARENVAPQSPVDKTLSRLLAQLKSFREQTTRDDIRKSAQTIITYLEYRISHDDQVSPLSNIELDALRAALRDHLQRPYYDPAILLKLAREELSLRDRINPFI